MSSNEESVMRIPGFMEHVDTTQAFPNDGQNRNHDYNMGNRSPKKKINHRTSPKRTSPKRRRSPDRTSNGSSNSKNNRDSFFKNPNPQNWGRGGRHSNYDGYQKFKRQNPNSFPPPKQSNGGGNRNKVQSERGKQFDRSKFGRGRKHFGMKQLNTKTSNHTFKSSKPRRGNFRRSRSWGTEPKFNRQSQGERESRPVRKRHNSDPFKSCKSNLYQPPNVSEIRPKNRLKHFSQEIKLKADFSEAEEYANEILEDQNYISSNQRWKVFLTVAELARRESRFQEARKWFRKAHIENANEPQIWLEYARMEEECGLLEKSEQVLLEGLEGCPYNENLYIKLIRQYEQLNQTDKARKLLGKIRTTLKDDLLRVWRVILEGAVMESRMGRIEEARIAFQFLMENCPQNGSIYLEALRLEQKREDDETSLRIIQLGLQHARTHAPLWVNAMRIYQKRGEFDDMRITVKEAVKHVTKEIKWKMYYYGAELEADSDCLERARSMFRLAIEFCPVPLRWKIWLAGSRVEVQSGREELAYKLLRRAESVVPKKYRYIVLLEYAKIEEFLGRLDIARRWMQTAKEESPHEWKVFLESVLLEMRHGKFDRAREEAIEGLSLHRGTGRLWAMHIRLQYHLGEEKQFNLFKKALRLVPKSGEVWCEGARIHLNPLSSLFSVQMAKKYLTFAIKFTPQFGDNFIEFMRAELMTYGPRIDEEDEIRHLERLCVNAEPNYGPLWFFCRQNLSESSIKVIRRSKSLLITELMKYQRVYQQAILAQNMEEKMKKKIINGLKKENEYIEFITGLRSFCSYNVDEENLNTHQKNVLKQSIFSDTFNI